MKRPFFTSNAYAALFIALAVIISMAFYIPRAHAQKSSIGLDKKWGFIMPYGGEEIQIYRDSAIFRYKADPESVTNEIISLAGGATRLRIFKSRVGSTIVVFIEDKKDEPWSSIQISGIIGERSSTVIITRKHAAKGWNWHKLGEHWVYR